MNNDKPRKSSWFSYCPFAYSGNDSRETERQHDDANTPVIYINHIGGKSDD